MKAHSFVLLCFDSMTMAMTALVADFVVCEHLRCQIMHLLMYSMLLINYLKFAVFAMKLVYGNFPWTVHFDSVNASNAMINGFYRDSKWAVKLRWVTLFRLFE